MKPDDWVLLAGGVGKKSVEGREDARAFYGASIDTSLGWLVATDNRRIHCVGGYSGLPDGFLVPYEVGGVPTGEGGYYSSGDYAAKFGEFPAYRKYIDLAAEAGRVYPKWAVSGTEATADLGGGKKLRIARQYLEEALEVMSAPEYYYIGERYPLYVCQGDFFAVICPRVDGVVEGETVSDKK